MSIRLLSKLVKINRNHFVTLNNKNKEAVYSGFVYLLTSKTKSLVIKNLNIDNADFYSLIYKVNESHGRFIACYHNRTENRLTTQV